eukprot:13692892-Ditylum_brightwellii.AAC.1
MYPSVCLRLIWKMLKYYTQNLLKEDRKTIDDCLDMIKFGKHSTLIMYHGKYYAYKGAAKGMAMEDEDITLAIGAYESALCTDIVASYVFEMAQVSFLGAKYRGKWTKMQIAQWLSQYQTLVNKVVEGDYLQFKMEVCPPIEASTNRTSGEAIEIRTHSPMEKWLKQMMWDTQGFLRFGVYHKEGQAIKYVDCSSCHRPYTFNSIAPRVYLCLDRLTLKT